MIRTAAAVLAILSGALCAGCAAPGAKQPAPVVVARSDVEAGRYLVLVGQCNDCHTAGYAQRRGAVPEAARLLGNPVGYFGPWGTSYASNLRLTAQNVSEDQWVMLLRSDALLPPMPTQNTSQMTERDLRAIYRYVRSLGPAGTPEPDNLGPGRRPATPYEDMHVHAAEGPAQAGN